MVKIARYLPLVCVLTLLGSPALLQAKELTAYNIGDRAEETITTPVAIDFTDPVATAAKKADEGLKAPAIFRNFAAQTNDVVNEFLSQFETSRKGFQSAVSSKFMKSTLDETTIASSEFTDLVNTFNKTKSKNFPITMGLARLWARGDSGSSVQVTMLGRLGEALRRPIAPDETPTDIKLGESIRIVPVKSPNEPLTLADAESRGKIGGLTSFRRLSSAKSIFKRAFPDDEQTTAKALTSLIKPDCVIDEQLTRQAREGASSGIVVPAHYDANTLIVRQGDVIDAKAKAAISQLANNAAYLKMAEQTKKAQQLALEEQGKNQKLSEEVKKTQQIANDQVQKLQNAASQAHANNVVLMAALGGVLVVSLLMVGTVWWLIKQKQVVPVVVPAAAAPVYAAAPAPAPAPAAPVAPVANGNGASRPAPVEMPAPQRSTGVKVNIAPPATATTPPPAPVMPAAAVPTMEMPARGTEPSSLQEMADAEISQLVKRLDKIYAPPHDRLRTYQLRLEDFERELAQRDVQNPALLKLKIETLKRQMDTERKKSRIDADWSNI